VASAAEINELAAEYCHDTKLKAKDIIAVWKETHGAELKLSEAVGCDHCNNSGYTGRIGLHELLVVSPTIREEMLRRANARELRATAIRDGMRTLKQDGIEKVFAGLIDIREVRAAAS
jgi:type II secretory ATPase GspE/PulE/Tfp pilus assembly ATPase PilB-like protein